MLREHHAPKAPPKNTKWHCGSTCGNFSITPLKLSLNWVSYLHYWVFTTPPPQPNYHELIVLGGLILRFFFISHVPLSKLSQTLCHVFNQGTFKLKGVRVQGLTWTPNSLDTELAKYDNLGGGGGWYHVNSYEYVGVLMNEYTTILFKSWTNLKENFMHPWKIWSWMSEHQICATYLCIW